MLFFLNTLTKQWHLDIQRRNWRNLSRGRTSAAKVVLDGVLHTKCEGADGLKGGYGLYEIGGCCGICHEDLFLLSSFGLNRKEPLSRFAGALST